MGHPEAQPHLLSHSLTNRLFTPWMNDTGLIHSQIPTRTFEAAVKNNLRSFREGNPQGFQIQDALGSGKEPPAASSTAGATGATCSRRAARGKSPSGAPWRDGNTKKIIFLLIFLLIMFLMRLGLICLLLAEDGPRAGGSRAAAPAQIGMGPCPAGLQHPHFPPVPCRVGKMNSTGDVRCG